ncbi:jg18466 [Pararge aegeria aegeria]|uniref:Jg18466 protein n=1 Tax=Pararge aegeria aegeria TaxID=348720 RepID=A0A8S4RMR7_9NEOP|nr:jg18466 [Pararge aegeria aegeria]
MRLKSHTGARDQSRWSAGELLSSWGMVIYTRNSLALFSDMLKPLWTHGVAWCVRGGLWAVGWEGREAWRACACARAGVRHAALVTCPRSSVYST